MELLYESDACAMSGNRGEREWNIEKAPSSKGREAGGFRSRTQDAGGRAAFVRSRMVASEEPSGGTYGCVTEDLN